ncbi:GTPase activating protein [Seiridium cupressi]
MFRRIVSLGQKAAEGPVEADDMSPSPGDQVQPPQDSKNSGGLAGVFKSLTGGSKSSKTTSAPVQTTGPIANTNVAEKLNDAKLSHSLSPNHMDAFEQLRAGSASERVTAAEQLRNAVIEHPLNPVLDIWYAAKDMIEPGNHTATRTAGWELLTTCVKHDSSTDLERKEYFQTLTSLANPEDFRLQLTALIELTNHGRNVSGFEYDIFPLVTSWLGMEFEAARAARKQASRTKGKAVASGEDQNFADLFVYIMDLIKFNFGVMGDEAAQALIDALVQICMNTSGTEDIRACIKVMSAIVTFGAIPSGKLKDYVHVLSSVHCMVEELQKDAWHALSILCRSHYGHAVVRTLLDVLSSLDDDTDKSKEGTRNVRGALSVLQKLISKSTEKGYPSVAYGMLVEGLSTVGNTKTSWKIHLDALRLINALFDGPKGSMNPMIVDEDWSAIFDVADACIETHMASTTRDDLANPPISRDNSEHPQTVMGREVTKLVSFLETLLTAQSGGLLQRQSCIIFFSKIHKLLPDTAAILVLDYYKEFRCCYPSDLDWEENLRLVLDVLFANRTRSSQLRVQALQVVTEVYDMVELVHDQLEPDFVPKLMQSILRDVAEESDIDVLEDIVFFAVSIASSADHPLFHYIVDTIRGILTVNRLRSSISPVVSSPSGILSIPEPMDGPKQSPSNVVAKGYVRIFVRVMHTDTVKAIRLFSLLVSIAKSNSTEADARLTAMKLLFRLRADWANRVYITTFTETENLAAALHRTDESLAKRHAEEAAQPSRLSRGEGVSGRISRGVSFGQGQTQERSLSERSFAARGSVRSLAPAYQQQWSASDTDVLPDRASRLASQVLSSSQCSRNPMESGERPGDYYLPTSEWLEAVIGLVQHGCEWEIQSYLLVYLPSQLSNHAMFKDAIPQIQELRKVVCELIRTNGFREPPSATGLRRADVAICLFHTLTMILSYHQHFQKTEEDEIVSTFVRGMATYERSAKCCIHALSICCYELPMSTSKALVTILQKMSQIITQPSIAIHILEFLACLARRPSLYSNFREDEHRIVFGICFRYLQYVREKKQSSRISASNDAPATAPGSSGLLESQAHPNASDDLPQYVYALAYHVITFWFLALKLPDRAKHVGWIAKNLFTDVDGSEVAEEQAQITIDFMQRVAYADVGESGDDPLFTSDRYGEVVRKRWLIGNSIVTVEQATSSGWAQITKRQPSGTSSYMIRESLLAPPAHQEQTTNEVLGRDGRPEHGDNVLPSHLLVQLLSSMPQCTDQARPIPLPDDESVDRALRVFDRSSTIDGHKVGVIYIGENQTDEVDILANVSGSREYVEFLQGLGTLVRLKGATFNTQGLDRQYETDGEFAICWRDRVTEIVFHVTTQMPTNLERDPQCTLKKRHIGNDFVNIIFNDSGLPFKFDTFPSDFNFVNIVITPESRASFVATRQRAPIGVRESFYNVQVMSKPGFPEISPASDTKIISLKALPDFIRLVALNASVFSFVWASREVGEHISPWRHRLREIHRLRERYGLKLTNHTHGPSPSPPGTALSGSAAANALGVQGDMNRPGSTVRDSFSSLRRASVATFFSNTSEPNTHSHRSSVLSTVPTESTEINQPGGCETLADKLDFSKWA